ncbi:hypothetical protein [African swine fever virus]|uniref:Uncharacterized protein n=1 Tax=African swine fever virus TaxID=10497 RepID=A0A3G1EVD7_ASF|nr:hypothetical protein F8221_gp130 [African swine fever virus]AOO54435.1 hypothetical protein AFSV47Ss_0130 [African swine fever virus]QID21261.1 hypothetical protein AFSV47Ss_0130 [African swine fever virus]QIM06771.1 hypothetical protein [African swine fever virus]QIM07006.1 hypothetical protein [African swine fever virus]QIM07241.1 hypothetical protein [African swine fever virus]
MTCCALAYVKFISFCSRSSLFLRLVKDGERAGYCFSICKGDCTNSLKASGERRGQYFIIRP